MNDVPCREGVLSQKLAREVAQAYVYYVHWLRRLLAGGSIQIHSNVRCSPIPS
jgi:hypothetical protein